VKKIFTNFHILIINEKTATQFSKKYLGDRLHVYRPNLSALVFDPQLSGLIFLAACII